MSSRTIFFTWAVALALPFACSAGTGDQATSGSGGASGRGGSSSGGSSGGTGGVGGMPVTPGDDRLFVPEGLPNTSADGDEKGRLMLVAFTLVPGPTGLELYAAVKNDGQVPSCNAGMMIQFYDKGGQHLPEYDLGTGLQSQELYRLDANTVLGCIDPGQIAMTSAKLPAALGLDNLGSLTHTFPTFIVDGIVHIGGFTVTGVKAVPKDAGGAYTGQLTNGLDVTVSAPSVSIFPVNRVGRPLGVATSVGTADVPPGGSWTFQTDTVNDLGAGFAAYPGASIPSP
jgi:hypothetical protein